MQESNEISVNKDSKISKVESRKVVLSSKLNHSVTLQYGEDVVMLAPFGNIVVEEKFLGAVPKGVLRQVLREN